MLPSVQMQYDHLSGSPADSQIDGLRFLYGGELTIQADKAKGSLTRRHLAATGHVRAHETDTTLFADTLLYDGVGQTASATGAILTQTPLTVQTPYIKFTPSEATADDVRLAAVPPSVHPDLFLRASEVHLFPDKNKGELLGASVYLFGGRILTLRRLGFSIGGGTGRNVVNRRQGVFPSAGASARYGPFLGIGGALPGVKGGRIHLIVPTRQAPQLRATASQSLLHVPPAPAPHPPPPSGSALLDSLRVLATARRRPLPPGDPLLFHNILPAPDPIVLFTGPPSPSLTLGEDITSHLESSGRRRSNLYVTRLPEVSLTGSLPLVRAAAPPAFGDPDAFRHALRRVVPILSAEAGYALIREQRPTDDTRNVRARRAQLGAGLSLAPLLVARNTLLLPRAQVTLNSYNKSPQTYRYTQIAVALEHDFSPRSAIGLQYLAADTHGDSPFDFDVLDTSRELDGRLQMGSRRITVAGEVRYDLRERGVIEYRLSIAPGLRGLRPIFSFNSRSGTVGVNAEIEGLTF